MNVIHGGKGMKQTKWCSLANLAEHPLGDFATAGVLIYLRKRRVQQLKFGQAANGFPRHPNPEKKKKEETTEGGGFSKGEGDP